MNLSLMLQIALVVANNHSYCLHQVGCERFNCADFTKTLVLELRTNNFTSYPALGYLNHKRHSWVIAEINETQYHIEPQTANLIYPSTVENYDYFSPYFFTRRGVVRGVY